MGEVIHVVDHLKLEYKGIFSIREMFRMFTRWMKEVPYEKGGDYVSEQHTSHGKCIEYTYYPWMKEGQDIRKYMKIRLLIYDLKKADVMVQGKKERLDHGKVILYIDGFIENDYEQRWSHQPMLQFIRTLYVHFLFERYTKYYRKMIIDDTHKLYEAFERFFNLYHTYQDIADTPYL